MEHQNRKNGKRKSNRKRKSDVRNAVTLTIALVLVFCLNNLTMSITDFIQDFTDGGLDSRTMGVTFGRDEEVRERFFGFVESKGYVLSTAYFAGELFGSEEIRKEREKILDLDNHPHIMEYTDIPSSVGVWSCRYEAIKPYLLTGDCGEPEGYEVIIPKYIVHGGMWSAHVSDGYIDGEKFLGKTIDGKMSCYRGPDGEPAEEPVSLTVIGLYDNIAAGLDDDFLISQDILEALDNRYYAEIDSDKYVVDNSFYYTYLVTVKEPEQLDLLEAELLETGESFRFYNEEYGFWIDLKCNRLSPQIDPLLESLCHAFQFAVNFIAFLLLVNTVINIVYATEHDIRERRREFGLLKAMGYQDGDIRRLLIKEKARISIAALLVTLLIGCAVLIGCNVFAHVGLNVYFNRLRFTVHPVVAVVTLLAGTFAPAAGLFAGARQLEAVNPIEALHDVDE